MADDMQLLVAAAASAPATAAIASVGRPWSKHMVLELRGQPRCERLSGRVFELAMQLHDDWAPSMAAFAMGRGWSRRHSAASPSARARAASPSWAPLTRTPWPSAQSSAFASASSKSGTASALGAPTALAAA